jgi:lysophospholipid acyltransferase (LPLAT)-like uncharacterized protein
VRPDLRLQSVKDLAWLRLGKPVGWALHAWSQVVLKTARVAESHAGPVPEPAIFVNWHRHNPLLVVHHGARGRWILMSGSPYMAPIADWAQRSGLRLIRGASGQGGRAALDKLAGLLRGGQSVVLAVDGPRGPAFRVRPGCVDLARMTGAPIVPVGYVTSPSVTIRRRWDKLLLVAPGGSATVRYGPAIRVDSSERDWTLEVERALNALSD